MTTHYDTLNYHHKLPHMSFRCVLKKAYLHQEQTMSALREQLRAEQAKAVNFNREHMQSKNIEIENLMN